MATCSWSAATMMLARGSYHLRLFAVLALHGFCACSATKSPAPNTPYLQRLESFRSNLTELGPAPQDYEPLAPPNGVREVVYESDGMQLKAWLAFPARPHERKLPAVVYFHGGFAFDASDFADAAPFLAHGFVVMAPMLRGENGNPGTYEMFLGEVRDAQAAVVWLATQERVDANRIYTFGHSAGGMISALLSLRETGIRHGGSSGGLYDRSAFGKLEQLVPFSLDDWEEESRDRTDRAVGEQMRTLVGNVPWMKTPHYAFVGLLDFMQAARHKHSHTPRTCRSGGSAAGARDEHRIPPGSQTARSVPKHTPAKPARQDSNP